MTKQEDDAIRADWQWARLYTDTTLRVGRPWGWHDVAACRAEMFALTGALPSEL